jgi:hypothetical protein
VRQPAEQQRTDDQQKAGQDEIGRSGCPTSTPTLKLNSASGMSRQTDLDKRTGEAKTVQQPEGEGHDPRPSSSKASPDQAANG